MKGGSVESVPEAKIEETPAVVREYIGVNQIRKMGPSQKKILLSQSESKKKYFKLNKLPRDQV